MAFRILRVGAGPEDFALNPADFRPYEFATGQEAQAMAKQIAMDDPSGTKWRVKRVLDTQWKSREQAKFDRGVYLYLPWSSSHWWNDERSRQVHYLHYAHVSRKEPGMVAYTESVDKGMDNKRTRIKPGRYLEKYIPPDVIKDYRVDIRKLSADFARHYEPRKMLIADTEDMVQWVYEHGPNSCMSSRAYREKHGWGWGSPGLWPNDIHCCRMYIAGDLQVAYLTDDDKPKSRVVARSVIWPAKKTYSRPYGDEQRMVTALMGAGYNFAAPIGAKIQRVKIDGGNGLFIVPYIDAGDQSGGGALAVKDAKDHLVICKVGPGTYPANTTSGASGRKLDTAGRPMEDNPEECSCCHAPADECENLARVYTSAAGGDYTYWCGECCDEPNAYICGSDGRMYRTASVACVTLESGAIWSEHMFRAHGFTCEATGKRYIENEAIVLGNGAKWHVDYFRDHGFRCDYTGDHWPLDNAIVTAEGHRISKDAFLRHGFTCRTCDNRWLMGKRYGRPPAGEQPQCISCHDLEVAASIVNQTQHEEHVS